MSKNERGVHVEGEEGVPVLGLDVGPRKRPQGEPLAPHRVALLADRLALARGECGQEIVEAAVAVIVPVILPAEPQQPAAFAEALPVGLAAEGGMNRADAVVAGDLGHHVDHGVADARGVGAGPREKARARHRREGNRDLQLGIVAAAGALEGLSPAVIEDIFALAVAFDVKRRGAEQRAVAGLGQQVLRLPAGSSSDRLGILQRLEKAVAQEGAAGRARRQRTGIPLVGVDRRQGLDQAQTDGR